VIVEAGVINVPAHLSPSSIGTWQQCPYRFRLSRLEKIPEPSTEAQLIGSFVHEVLEFLYRDPQAIRTVQRAKQLSRALWNEKWADEVQVLDLSPVQLNAFRWNSWWCIESFFNMENPTAHELDGIEQKLEWQVGDAKVVGIIDRWNKNSDGSATISDYKTGKKPKPRFESEKRFQLGVYVNMIESLLDIPVSYAELLYLKEGIRWGFEPTSEMRQDVIKTISIVWQEVVESCLSGKFECKTSKLCDWCSYQSICPAWSKQK
jgi:putative RecB family exonuclease